MSKLCPICGTPLLIIPPPKGYTDYFLSSYNVHSKSIDPSTGFAITLLGCPNCGNIQLHSDKLIGATKPVK